MVLNRKSELEVRHCAVAVACVAGNVIKALPQGSHMKLMNKRKMVRVACVLG